MYFSSSELKTCVRGVRKFISTANISDSLQKESGYSEIFMKTPWALTAPGRAVYPSAARDADHAAGEADQDSGECTVPFSACGLPDGRSCGAT